VVRQAHHEREKVDHYNFTPFALSLSKGGRRVFQQPVNDNTEKMKGQREKSKQSVCPQKKGKQELVILLRIL
jgi:hypothetical protein